ncbi:hypothetical protein KR767_18010 [Luteibacter anthropi]|uniref:DUF2188 domain-containing protein n=1 Tax=Luteibacter anthropi TaxID=564369 RepID=A0A7X5ZHC0_9GAMM|nr:hypothetical protein [Luteibacter anthropi]NII05703.1 hypothetical protein [Luteibacter anthropi]URX61923.1 hypothetical protein KR767_18010 [Luteibacter anthropi]
MQRTTLYLPFTTSPRGVWNVRRNADIIGQFPTRDEAMRHALSMIESITVHGGQPVDLKVEDEDGTWHLAELPEVTRRRI